MKGYVQFTGDEQAARQTIQERFDQACGNKAEIVTLHMERADSLIGIHHIAYDALAKCQS